MAATVLGSSETDASVARIELIATPGCGCHPDLRPGASAFDLAPCRAGTPWRRPHVAPPQR